VFKPFGGGLWLIFQDESDIGVLIKLTTLGWIIYIEFVNRPEGMEND
jgi:hypothetical protein